MERPRRFFQCHFYGAHNIRIKSHYNYRLLMCVRSSGWGPSPRGSLESAWRAVGTEAPISKVELCV